MSVDFGRNTDDNIVMNPSRSMEIPQPQITRTILINYNIFDSVSRGLPWHYTMKIKFENLVENLRGKKNFKNAEGENNSEVETFGHKKYVNWDHTDSVLNLNIKKYD